MAITAAEQAVLQAGLERGYLTRAQVEEALELHELSAQLGQPQAILAIVSARFLTPPQRLELFEVFQRHQAAPAAAAPPPPGAALPALPPTPSSEPARVADFEVVRELGRGGVGAVYEARSPRFSEPVALKALLEQADEPTLKRFQAEARAAGRLRHENIVRVLEHGQAPDGRWYLAMELIEGESIDARIERDGPLPPREAAHLALELADALGYAHEAGVLHRDLKPHNVLIDRAGTVRLTDFGLAKVLSESKSQALTRTGDILGTPVYMSPEQARGERGAIGPATDVYGLGAALYHMLTGRTPVEGDSLTAVLLHIAQRPPRPLRSVRPEVPPELEAIVARCLEKEPGDRYPDAFALARALNAFLGQRGGPAGPGGLAPRLVLGGAAGLLALLGLVFVMTSGEQRAPTAEAAAPREIGPSEVAPARPPETASDPPAGRPPASDAPERPRDPEPRPPARDREGPQPPGRGRGEIAYAPSWAEALAEAEARNVPLVLITVDEGLPGPPRELRGSAVAALLSERAVAVASCADEHVGGPPGPRGPGRPAEPDPGRGGCRVFPGLACADHVAVASELAAGPLAPPRRRRFPPRAAVCTPSGELETELEGRALSPDALEQAVARLQGRLGPPRDARSR